METHTNGNGSALAERNGSGVLDQGALNIVHEAIRLHKLRYGSIHDEIIGPEAGRVAHQEEIDAQIGGKALAGFNEL